jgi:NADP-dependent 3-hydroxy acid dehydrogenase YdfG
MLSLANQVAVVTGAGSGIGKAIALSLAADGAKVCLVGRSLERLQAVADSAKGSSGAMTICEADLGVDADIHNLAARLERDFGGVDILVHSAGVMSMGKTEQASMDDFDRQYRINVRGPYLLTQALLPLLKVRPGQVVFVNSSAGLTARAGVGQYAATKHALKAVADSLREEVNAEGIRVLSVYPGRTASPMQEAVFALENRAYHPERLMQPADVASVVVHALRLPRTAEVTDISIRPLLKP